MGELDWDDLRYFLRGAQTKSLAAAARSLGVEHTTMGRRLDALERTLGTSLALRSRDGLRLTQAGTKVAALVEDIDRLVQSLPQVVAGEQARVRVAIPSAFVEIFAARLATLDAEDPALALELVSGARVVDLRRGEADLAVRIGPGLDGADDALVIRKLGEVGSALYAARRYLADHRAPKQLDDVAAFRGHRVIAFAESLAALPAARWLEQRATHATIALRCREMVDMLAATRAGLGLAVLPCYLGDRDRALVRLSVEPLASRPVFLLYAKEARISKPFRAVARFVVEVMTDAAAMLRGERPTKTVRSRSRA